MTRVQQILNRNLVVEKSNLGNMMSGENGSNFSVG